MARVLLLNPGRWGRGITPIWIASHAALLRAHGHVVELFDCTFYDEWAEKENDFNTLNGQYKPTPYAEQLQWHTGLADDLQETLQRFKPDIVFWSALSSHIHGEGEYVNIQYGCELMSERSTNAVLACGGLQPTADLQGSFTRFSVPQILITGESEKPLAELADAVEAGDKGRVIAGIHRRQPNGAIESGPRQPILDDLDCLGAYDYSLFDDQVFLRPYNGDVVRAVDYEMSRGCVFTCTYCVETVIQKYYGFTESNSRGALIGGRRYVRTKSAPRVIEELAWLSKERGVTLVRCQDTNFLTINPGMLSHLADLFERRRLPLRLYIETRPEGINSETVALLQRLQVDGVGMGIELATQSFRETRLNRFSDQRRIVEAFRMLREAGIRRTAYNIIGLAGQNEESIIETIEFNRVLDPDNVTVAFYSPFIGTGQHQWSADEGLFSEYEYRVDPQLRTLTRHDVLTPEMLAFYKAHFNEFVREGLAGLVERKRAAGLASA